jgi:hypothetical protein
MLHKVIDQVSPKAIENANRCLCGQHISEDGDEPAHGHERKSDAVLSKE